MLKERGIVIARRTVDKYRTALNILTSQSAKGLLIRPVIS